MKSVEKLTIIYLVLSTQVLSSSVGGLGLSRIGIMGQEPQEKVVAMEGSTMAKSVEKMPRIVDESILVASATDVDESIPEQYREEVEIEALTTKKKGGATKTEIVTEKMTREEILEAAKAPTSQGVEEIYATLSMRNLKNDFFPLLMTGDERKYIAMEDLVEFLDLQMVELTPGYRIVGRIGEEDVDTSYAFPENLSRQGKVYVPVDRLKEVIPIEHIAFFEDTYTLNIVPKFKLSYEIAKEALERRRELEYSGDKVEERLIYSTPKKLFDLGIVSAEYEKYNFSNGDNLLTLGYASQLLYGDFNISGDVMDDTELNYVNLDYEDVEFLGDRDVRFGDFYLRTYSQLPIERSLRGISITGNDTYGRRDNDKIVVDGQARGAETIELYQNGILIEYEDIDDDVYSFEVETITNDDEYVIKSYYPNGRVEEKTIYVLSDSQIFPQGNWDYIVQAGRGKEYEEDQAMFNVKYGFTDYMTLGIGASSFNEDDGEDYSLIEGNFALRTGAWIFPSMLIGDYFYDTDEDEGTLLLTFTQKIGDYTFDIDYNNYSDRIAENRGEDEEVRVSVGRTYKKINWRARYSWETYDDLDYEEAELDIYYRRNNYRLYALNTYEMYDSSFDIDDLYTVELGIDYTGNKYLNLNFSTELRSDGEQDNEYQIRVSRRERMGQDDHYIDVAGELEFDESDDEWIATLELAYYFDSFMRVNMPLTWETGGADPELGLSVEKAIALKDPIGLQYIKDRDTFWLSGQIYRDSNGNGILDDGEETMEGVGISIDGQEVFTKADGSFLVQNIQASKEIQVRLIRETLDPTLDTAVEKIYVMGNIAENMTYDIPLLPLSSVGGYINLGKEDGGNSFIFSKTIIEFMQDGEVKYSTSPEADGFFIIDTILPGEYDVEVTYLGQGKRLTSDKPLIFAIPKSVDGDYYEVEYQMSVEEVEVKGVEEGE